MKYSKAYWDDYYGGPYDRTFQYGFHLYDILASCWDSHFADRPNSFADIGSGPGHTLVVAEKLLPGAKLYGVECQNLPRETIAHANVVLGDFLSLAKDLPAVDLLYCSCSMYIPWHQQEVFLSQVLRLAKKAVVFANLYLTAKDGIPEDSLRKVIYSDRASFASVIEKFPPWQRTVSSFDFFIKP